MALSSQEKSRIVKRETGFDSRSSRPAWQCEDLVNLKRADPGVAGESCRKLDCLKGRVVKILREADVTLAADEDTTTGLRATLRIFALAGRRMPAA